MLNEKLSFCWHFECFSFAFSRPKQQREEKKSHRRSEEFEEWKIDSCEHEFCTHGNLRVSGRASNLMWACHAFRDSQTARNDWVRKHVEIPFDVNWFWKFHALRSKTREINSPWIIIIMMSSTANVRLLNIWKTQSAKWNVTWNRHFAGDFILRWILNWNM